MDMTRLHALFDGLPRHGVGSDAATQEALRRLRAHGLPDDPAVLDIGCGPGRQTMILGRVTGGRVTAIDIHPPSVAETQRKIAEAGLGRRMQAECRSMTELDVYGEGRFDLLWAEGSIFIIGFDDGLRRWRPLLRPGGLVGVSELTWLAAHPPAEAAAFWAEHYPAMRGTDANRRAAEQAGYAVLDTITLPPAAWWTDYLTPLERRVAEMRDRHRLDPEWDALLNATQAEIDLYRRCGASYGYVFYLLRRLG